MDTRPHCELKEGRFRFDITRKFFTWKLVRHSTRLCREAVDDLSLEMLKDQVGWGPGQCHLVDGNTVHVRGGGGI